MATTPWLVGSSDSSAALLGRLLGLTFAVAVGKSGQRRLMIVADSNAVGDF